MTEYKEHKKTTLTVLLCVSLLHIIILFIICFLGSKISSYNLNSKEDNIYVDFAVVQEQTIPTEPLVPLSNESNTVEQEPDPVEPLPIEPEPEPEPEPVKIEPKPVVPPQKTIQPPKPKKTPAPVKPSSSSVPKKTPSSLPTGPRTPSSATGVKPATIPLGQTAPKRSSGGDAIVLRRVKPSYPSLSRRKGEQGSVTLEVLVKADGSAGTVTVKTSSGFSRLDKAAVNAVRRWRFEPHKINGLATDHQYDIVVNFSLAEN